MYKIDRRGGSKNRSLGNYPGFILGRHSTQKLISNWFKGKTYPLRFKILLQPSKWTSGPSNYNH